MFLSLLTLGLVGHGYFYGDIWAIVGGVGVGIIAIRQTVFSYDKIGTLVNFIIVIVGVALGALNFYGFTIPSFTDSGASEQEVAKKITQPAVSIPVAKSPTVKVTPPNPFHPPALNATQMAYLLKEPCAEQSLFDVLVFGQDDIEILYVKICRDSKEIRIKHVPNNPQMFTELLKGQYLGTDKSKWRTQDFLNMDFLSDAVVLSPKVEEMRKVGVENVIVHMYINRNFVVD